MASVTVRCPHCTFEKTLTAGGVVPKDWKAHEGQLLCPNCDFPMQPLGVVAAVQTAADLMAATEPSLPPSETLESLSKRLKDIDEAHSRVRAAQLRYEEKHDAAKDAKKYLDAQVESFITLAGRLSALANPLPLFTAEAEQSAAAPEPGQTLYTGLYERLVEAGYHAVGLRDLSSWTPEQRQEATAWTEGDASEDALPAFMRELAAFAQQAVTV